MCIYDFMCIQCMHMIVLCIMLDLQCISTNIHGSEFKWGSASNTGDEYQGFNSGQPSHKMASGTWMETSTYSQPNPNNPSI